MPPQCFEKNDPICIPATVLVVPDMTTTAVGLLLPPTITIY